MMQVLRDIHQLHDAPAWGPTAIEGLLTVEEMLQEAVRFVPYCKQHRGVWSSHFAGILLEAASQTDSIWKATTKLDDPAAGDRLTIKDHHNRFGKLVAKQQVVFFGGEAPATVCPFEEWQNSDASPTWWLAYNALKHDRFSNQTCATLEHAVNAIGGLLLAMIYCGQCDIALISAGLLDAANHNPWAYTESGLLRDVDWEGMSKIESKLFAHPLGVFGVLEDRFWGDWRSSSARFNIWWARNVEGLRASQEAIAANAAARPQPS